MPTHSPAILRRRLEEIDAEIASFHIKLSELAVARRVVVEQLKRVVYPVLELPVEISSKIFLAYTQDVRIEIGREQLEGPFVLASVCRHWREIAIRLHELWTRIHLYGHGQTVSSRMERRVGLCLERAGAHSDLDIDYFGPNRILPFLISSAGQWSNLQLHNDADDLHWTGIRGRLHRLRRLMLTDHPLNIGFDDAPMLEEVELQDIDLSMVSLPWAQLKCLTLCYTYSVALEDCLRLLRQTPNLQTLHLRIPQDSDPQPHQNFPELRLENLRTLSFEDVADDSAAPVGVMNVLVAPVLANFTTDIPSEDSGVVLAVAGMLARSKCGQKMRSLTLNMDGGDLWLLHRILELIPFLEKLSVTQVAWDQLDKLFGVLLRTRKDTSALSTRIRHLHLEPLPQHIPYTEIASFVSVATTQANVRDDGTGLCRLEFRIPSDYPEYAHTETEQERVLSAIKGLRSMAAASPGGLEISIEGHKNSFLSSSGRRPPLHTLEDWPDS